MKYCPGVPTCAPSGLRTHICQVPRTQAPMKAAKATQKCARQSRSTLRTGDPSVLIRLEFVLWQHLNGRPHFAVAHTAIFMTWHEQIARAHELGVHLRDKAWYHHRVYIGAGDQEAVN